MKAVIQFVQFELSKRGYTIDVDGLFGSQTIGVLDKFLFDKAYLTKGWNSNMKMIASLQIILNDDDWNRDKLKVDGFFGPQTEYVFETHLEVSVQGKALNLFRDQQDEESPSGLNPHGFPKADFASMCEYYGEPGDPSTLMMIDLPYAMKIAWNPAQKTQKMQVNKKLGEVIYKVLDNVLDVYGLEAIEEYGLNLFGGCFNYRNKRGGSSLSIHSWGAALDFDPERNKLKWNHTQAQFAKPAYTKWNAIWQAEGFVSLGKTKDYDWMHYQATQ